jgi:hypothetical protein
MGVAAVQVVHYSRRGSQDTEDIGAAYDPAGLEALCRRATDPLSDDLRETLDCIHRYSGAH